MGSVLSDAQRRVGADCWTPGPANDAANRGVEVSTRHHDLPSPTTRHTRDGVSGAATIDAAGHGVRTIRGVA